LPCHGNLMLKLSDCTGQQLYCLPLVTA
jgi:hypothetical protein